MVAAARRTRLLRILLDRTDGELHWTSIGKRSAEPRRPSDLDMPDTRQPHSGCSPLHDQRDTRSRLHRTQIWVPKMAQRGIDGSEFGV